MIRHKRELPLISLNKLGTLGLAGIIAILILTSCSSTTVQMCDSPFLAKPEMQMNHRAHDLAIDDHIYFSKEAASGGRGFGGGGCGCN